MKDLVSVIFLSTEEAFCMFLTYAPPPTPTAPYLVAVVDDVMPSNYALALTQCPVMLRML